MSDDLVIVPSDGEGYVELARTKSGRLFKKHILNLGSLRHPATGKAINIDDAFITTLKKNFSDGVCDIVQVPLANAKNEHSEDPERNIGEVVDLQVKDKKVYAVIDVRDDKHADRMGKTYLGASAMMHLDYTDTKTGQRVGPTLLHACVTNRPYVTGLESYEEIVAATSDTSEEPAVVLLTDDVLDVVEPVTEERNMPEEKTTTPEATAVPTLEEMLAILKTDHNIDVPSLQAKATENSQAATLSQTLVDALKDSGLVKLANTDQASTEDVVGAVQELASDNVALTSRLTVLERRDAESVVDGLIAEAKILPAKRKVMVELKLSNPDLFDELVPDQPLVKLNAEAGVTPKDDDAHKADIDASINKYVAMANAK